MSNRVRGVQEIRTHSAVLGSGSHSKERHVRQFQLAALELERTRRTRERDAALRRVRDIDTMLAEIALAMLKHQEALGLGPAAGTEGEGPPEGQENEGEGAVKRRVLRY